MGERVTSEETVLKKRRRSTYCMAQTNDLKSQHGGTPLPQASAALRRRLRSYYTQTAMYKKKTLLYHSLTVRTERETLQRMPIMASRGGVAIPCSRSLCTAPTDISNTFRRP